MDELASHGLDGWEYVTSLEEWVERVIVAEEEDPDHVERSRRVQTGSQKLRGRRPIHTSRLLLELGNQDTRPPPFSCTIFSQGRGPKLHFLGTGIAASRPLGGLLGPIPLPPLPTPGLTACHSPDKLCRFQTGYGLTPISS